MLSKINAIKELSEMDHGFLSPEGVKRYGEPFNVYHTSLQEDKRSQVKGLHLFEGKEGDATEGLASDELASMICEKLGLEVAQVYGRGTRLRMCCTSIIEFLKEGERET